VIFQCLIMASFTGGLGERRQCQPQPATTSCVFICECLAFAGRAPRISFGHERKRIIEGEIHASETTLGPNRPLGSRGAIPHPTATADRYFELKVADPTASLIGVLNLERASSIPKDRNPRAEIGRVVERLLDEESGVPMTTAGAEQEWWKRCSTKVLGLGPLEPLLKEPSNQRHPWSIATTKVFIERNRQASPRPPCVFKDDGAPAAILSKRSFSQVGPGVSTRRQADRGRAGLADGSRVNAIHPAGLALDGPCLSIRRFGRHVITPGRDDPVQDAHPPACCAFLSAVVQCKSTVP